MTTLRTLILVTTVSTAAVVVGCHGGEPEQATVDLQPVKSRIVSVARIHESKPIEIYGLVQPARQAFVSSRVVGPVVAVAVDAGDLVKKDDVLVNIAPQTIDGQVSQAKGALAQAQAALALAEKNFQRFERLHATGAASDVELDMARMQFDQAKGAVKQAEGAVQSASSVAGDAEVRSPFNARVVNRMVEVGDLAAPGRPLVQVESLSGSKIWLTVREADIRRVRVGQVLDIRFDNRPDLAAVPGAVQEIVPSADPATHTFIIKVGLGNTEVLSGVSGRTSLPGDGGDLLVVPAGAVHHRGGLDLVVIRGENGTARTRAVTTGRTLADGRIEVLSGLDEGDPVVVDAPGPLADGTPVEVIS
jgi:RND family efflux transporter MFP subunit